MPSLKPSRPDRRVGAFVLFLATLGVVVGCSTGGTPSIAVPSATTVVTVTSTTIIRNTTAAVVTVTETPTTSSTPPPPAVQVTATFNDNSTFECDDTSVDSCWALEVTTDGPCPNGVYVAINVYNKGGVDVLEMLETTSAPVTEPAGGAVVVQLGQTGLSPTGDPLEASLKEARCA